jgi:hypothetical protein
VIAARVIYSALVTWLVVALGYYERKARKTGNDRRQQLGLVGFCSQIDLGGNILLCAAFGIILVPITLAGTGEQKFQTPYIPTLLALDICALVALLVYDHRLAKHPVLPLCYFSNLTIVLVLVIATMDYFALQITHA